MLSLQLAGLLPLMIDSILLDYHLGHAIIGLFAVTTLGALPLKSQKVIAVNVMVFGAIFAMAPYTTMPPSYIMLGLLLLIVGPLLWTTADS